MSQCDITIPHGVPEVGGVGHRHAGEGELAEHGLDTMLLLLTQHMTPATLLPLHTPTPVTPGYPPASCLLRRCEYPRTETACCSTRATKRGMFYQLTEAELSHHVKIHVKILRIIPCTTICNHEEKFEPLGISEIWSTCG